MSENKLRAIASRRELTPRQQRRLWARATVLRHFMIKAGLCTVDEFRRMEDEVLQSVEEANIKNLKMTVGADDE